MIKVDRLDDMFLLDGLTPSPSHLLMIQRWTEHHSRRMVPDDFLRLTRRGMSITVYHSYIDGGWRTTSKVAQLRWNLSIHKWMLWWADRNDHWQPYQPEIATRQVGRLLRLIDEDADGAFWG